MPHVSKNRLSKSQEIQIINAFHLILAKIKDSQEMSTFLASLLTPTEEIMLAKRIAVMFCIQEGLDDTTISNNLHVTRVTVSRLRYFLESRGQGFSLALTILKREELFEEIVKQITSIVNFPDYVTGRKIKSGFF